MEKKKYNTDKHVSIEHYENAEILGRTSVPNSFLKSVSPLTYMLNGFPTKVYYEQELIRYIDSQHLDTLEHYVNHDCDGLTEQEYLLIRKLTISVFDYTRMHYGKEFLVKAPIIDAAFISRLIHAISIDNDITITEIGAGSGMLGALLLSQGYRYNCVDVTQAFYLTQNRLLSKFATSMDELVMDSYNRSQFVHIPYWKLWELRNESIETDIFTCNHALLEIPENAIAFYLKLAKKWMKNSRVGVFLIRSWGWETLNKKENVIHLFQKEGFQLIYLDNIRNIAVFDLFSEQQSPQDFNSLVKQQLFFERRGKKIHQKLNRLDKPRKMDDLLSLYNAITPNQDSPDQEFFNYCYEDGT